MLKLVKLVKLVKHVKEAIAKGQQQTAADPKLHRLVICCAIMGTVLFFGACALARATILYINESGLRFTPGAAVAGLAVGNVIGAALTIIQTDDLLKRRAIMGWAALITLVLGVISAFLLCFQ